MSTNALQGVLRLGGQRGYRYIATRLHQGIQRPFELDGITYHPEPCSVGLTPHGRITGASAVDTIRDRGLAGLRVLDICCGVGIAGLTMLSLLRGERRIESMTLADINVFNIASLTKTLAMGSRELLGEYEIDVVLSDGLQHLQPANQFDLIVSNPPHYRSDPSDDTQLEPSVLGTYDTDWGFHRRFYESCHEYLTERGEVWFLEAQDAASRHDLIAMVELNPQLQLLGYEDDRRDPRVYWIRCRRRMVP
jgi:methylase of polypeptide subunit release factors